MQITKEHKALIESIIKENEKFAGNEELLDFICDAVYKKSYLVIDAIRDVTRLKHHLKLISDNAIEQIVKEKNKYKKASTYRQMEHKKKAQEELEKLTVNFNKSKDRIVSLRNSIEKEENVTIAEPFYNKTEPKMVNLKEEIQRSEKYDTVDDLVDPLDLCPQKRVSEHTIDKLVQLIKSIDRQYPKKKYYKMFLLRYIKKYNQTEIAQEMRISQLELSKRFVELVKLTKEKFD